MRTTFLVCYDVADDKRLRRAFKTCCNFGDHLQYSVFECDLNPSEKIELEDVEQDYQSRRRSSAFCRAWASGRTRRPGDYRAWFAVHETGCALLCGLKLHVLW